RSPADSAARPSTSALARATSTDTSFCAPACRDRTVFSTSAGDRPGNRARMACIDRTAFSISGRAWPGNMSRMARSARPALRASPLRYGSRAAVRASRKPRSESVAICLILSLDPLQEFHCDVFIQEVPHRLRPQWNAPRGELGHLLAVRDHMLQHGVADR